MSADGVLRLGFVPGVVPFKWVSRFRAQFGDEALLTSRLGAGDAAGAALADGELDAALMPLPVDKDVFHAIPLYIESDDQKGRVPGREIGLVWLKTLEHPLIEPLTGIVRGRTANSSRGDAEPASVSTPSGRKPAKPIASKKVNSTAKPQGKNIARRRQRSK